MTVYKYAVLTQIDDNQYEVCHIQRIIDEVDNLERINRIEEALLSGENISGVSANGRTGLLLGSTWDGTQFFLPNPMPENFIGTAIENGIAYTNNNNENFSAYAFLKGNKVFWILAPLKESLLDIKLEAAFENNVTLKKIDDNAIVTLGYIWDGNNFNPPA
jgi:hypothetical protein